MGTRTYFSDQTSTTPCRCDNCDWTGPANETNGVLDAYIRMEPGGIVPAGECPECTCLAYPVAEDDSPDGVDCLCQSCEEDSQ